MKWSDSDRGVDPLSTLKESKMHTKCAKLMNFQSFLTVHKDRKLSLIKNTFKSKCIFRVGGNIPIFMTFNNRINGRIVDLQMSYIDSK